MRMNKLIFIGVLLSVLFTHVVVAEDNNVSSPSTPMIPEGGKQLLEKELFYLGSYAVTLKLILTVVFAVVIIGLIFSFIIKNWKTVLVCIVLLIILLILMNL